MSFGAGLVILGVSFNLLFPFLVTHAVFTDVRYRNLKIEDKDGQITLATMKEGYTPMAHLGENREGQTTFSLYSSERDDEMITISTDKNGGSLDCFNQTGENAISLTVGLGGSGLVERILKDSSDSKDQ